MPSKVGLILLLLLLLRNSRCKPNTIRNCFNACLISTVIVNPTAASATLRSPHILENAEGIGVALP